MEETPNHDSFVKAVECGQDCFTQVPFQDLLMTIEALSDLGLHRNIPPSNWGSLSGLCPKCTTWVDGETLGMVFVVEQMGRKKVSMNRYGDLSHLLNRHCPNSSCSSSDILLIWQGDLGIRNQITEHLQRIKTHVMSSDNAQWLDYVAKLEDEQVLRFTQDAIFGLERRCTNTHLIVGRRFPKMVLWVSFLPSVSKATVHPFPAGYRAYLSGLLGNSEFDQGDTTVGHWISFENRGERLLNLALLSDKNSIGTTKEFALFPAEIVQAFG